MRSRLLPLLLALTAVGLAAPAWGDSPPARTPEAQARAALDGLRSPFLRERREAARALAGLLPGSRAVMLEAWRAGDEQLRVELADVLATEGSVEAMSLLLEAWMHGPDTLAAEVRGAVILNPLATRAGLAAVRARGPSPGARSGTRDLKAIDELLVRDEVEKLFLSRKSKSGGTGVYRGQYEVLLPHREMALEVCFHILTDHAMYLPSTPAVGGYRFLERRNQVLDTWEIREMALSAIADLARPTDRGLILRLDKYLRLLAARRDTDHWDDVPGDAEKDALYNDLLVTLYRLRPTIYKEQFEDRIREREREYRRRPLTTTKQELISMWLRAGLYELAIDGYLELRGRTQSPASDHYNLACAYALWSLEPGDANPVLLRSEALEHLDRAVSERWTDVGWMEQDRDLDPIRDTNQYRALVERVRRTIAGDEP